MFLSAPPVCSQLTSGAQDHTTQGCVCRWTRPVSSRSGSPVSLIWPPLVYSLLQLQPSLAGHNGGGKWCRSSKCEADCLSGASRACCRERPALLPNRQLEPCCGAWETQQRLPPGSRVHSQIGQFKTLSQLLLSSQPLCCHCFAWKTCPPRLRLMTHTLSVPQLYHKQAQLCHIPSGENSSCRHAPPLVFRPLDKNPQRPWPKALWTIFLRDPKMTKTICFFS